MKNSKNKWKKEDILTYFGEVDNPKYFSDVALLRAMLHIYLNQTSDERVTESTNENNGIGFTGCDAKLLSSFSKQLIQYGNLSQKQFIYIRKKMRKYAGQIAKAINCNLLDKNKIQNDSINKWKRNNENKYNKFTGELIKIN